MHDKAFPWSFNATGVRSYNKISPAPATNGAECISCNEKTCRASRHFFLSRLLYNLPRDTERHSPHLLLKVFKKTTKTLRWRQGGCHQNRQHRAIASRDRRARAGGVHPARHRPRSQVGVSGWLDQRAGIDWFIRVEGVSFEEYMACPSPTLAAFAKCWWRNWSNQQESPLSSLGR